MHAYTGSGAAFRSKRTFYDGRLSGIDLCYRTINWIRGHYPEVPCPVHFQGHAACIFRNVITPHFVVPEMLM